MSSEFIRIDEEDRRSLKVKDYEYGEIELWIEGIGSTNGLFYPAPYGIVDLGIPELLCVHTDNKQIYQNPNTDNCYQDTFIGIKEATNTPYRIYPTKAKDVLYFESENYKDNTFHYKIYDYNGNLSKNGMVVSNKIDISILSNGCYFLRLFDKNNIATIFTNRFLKF